MSACKHGIDHDLECHQCEDEFEAAKAKVPTKKPMPSLEQMIAVIKYKERIGREWKRCLLDAWACGEDEGERDDYLLRQVRNQFGPAWILAFDPSDYVITQA
jgi:hypothetical protein